MQPIVLRLRPAINFTDKQFFEFCQLNRDLRLEMTATGELIVMPPTGSETGNRNFGLTGQLWVWTEQDGTGIGFDSSTGFTLPNSAKRSPDAAWIKLERWNALSESERQEFAPIVPDFVIELRSPSDGLKMLQSKMQEYIDNGAQLGWLLDRKQHRVYIYRPNMPVECMENPATISANPVLEFELNLSKIW